MSSSVPRLEVLSRKPAGCGQHPPVVLVHGAWHGAWCWQGNFLDFFADHGYEVHAPSLRGHGGSAGRSGLRWWSIADYVQDLKQVVDTIGRPPLIIAHSMGGFITQKYLQQHQAAGAVLLASVPSRGTLGFNLRVIGRRPTDWLLVNLTMDTWWLLRSQDRVREYFFTERFPQASLAAHYAQLQPESFRASLDMLLLDLPQPASVVTPMAVYGAAHDGIFTVEEVRATARAYAVEAEIFPDLAHNMMSEPGWEQVAQRAMDWGVSNAGG